MRRKHEQMSQRELKIVLDTLETAANSFSNDKTAKNFIDQVLTEGEQITIGRRIAVAQLFYKDVPILKLTKSFKWAQTPVQK